MDKIVAPFGPYPWYKFWVRSHSHRRRDPLGSVVGLLVFAGGVLLLLLTFRLAYEMFAVPPKVALGVNGAKQIDFGVVGNALSSIIVRIVLLLIMGILGSWIANRGIHLYTHCLATHPKPPTEPDPNSDAPTS